MVTLRAGKLLVTLFSKCAHPIKLKHVWGKCKHKKQSPVLRRKKHPVGWRALGGGWARSGRTFVSYAASMNAVISEPSLHEMHSLEASPPLVLPSTQQTTQQSPDGWASDDASEEMNNNEKVVLAAVQQGVCFFVQLKTIVWKRCPPLSRLGSALFCFGHNQCQAGQTLFLEI